MNKTQKVRIETPMGAIESDSGNHLVDIGTIFIFVAFLLLVKKLIQKFML